MRRETNLGDSGVGKTSVLQRFSEGSFVSTTRATVGIDLKRSAVDLDGDGSPHTLQIWDTAGQEMFRSIIASYYRGAHAVILMFDVCRPLTFSSLDGWLQEVRSKASESVTTVLVGNKVDSESRQVTQEHAAEWAERNAMPYVETSAKLGFMIHDAFITLVAGAVGRIDELPTLLTTAKVVAAGAADKMNDVGVMQLNGGGGRPGNPPRSFGCAC